MVKSERKEALLKIIIAIISGIILKLWSIPVLVIGVLNWLVTLITGKRRKVLASFCEYWNTEFYKYLVYLTSVTNERPFPFHALAPRISKFTK
ncbi:DUF4389 domain-containing protein [Candidatus Pacearchaeota archaeon]|nr:DUF4389 domain-containing protein [Candidatus Pacearchaeota archaeon]